MRAYRVGVWLIVPLLIVAGQTVAQTGSAPVALACPSGQPVWLRGRAAPGTPLISSFAGSPVGGGSAAADGSWAIPLTVQARAGRYPVDVRRREDGALVAAFTCFVDLPVGATPSATSTPWPTRVPATPSPGAPTSAPSPTAPHSELDAPPASSATRQQAEASTATAELPFTPEPTPSAISLTPTTSPLSDTTVLQLAAVVVDDPEAPGLFEYVLVENPTGEPVALAGWRLTHQETGATYAFPDAVLPPGAVLVVWSGADPDDLASGSLSWPASAPRWTPGQTAVLYDPVGRPVSVLVVPDAGGAEP